MQIPSMSIQVLPPEVVDQIAAGEVVERPSHLVKELVENAIDAGATQVHVEYSRGGKSVKVTDNGAGMTAAELPKALERFATSKIAKTDDLWRLRTFGFRGEALASIAAVSRLTLTSRQKGDEQAHRMISEFGQRRALDAVGGSPGTSILIEDLFENTPARLKFMKSDSAESTAIKTTLKAMALSHPEVEFRIQENGKLIYFWPVCASRKDRVEQVLEIKPLYVGEAVRDKMGAFAVFADPHHVAKTSRNIWLFAQNRWIQDRSLQAAVSEAYRSLLMHGEYPIAVVWVETDPASVDVNIHPTKSQVKFQEPSLAFRAVAGALRSSLEMAPWVPQTAKPLASPLSSATAESFVVQKENMSFVDAALTSTQFQKKPHGFSSSRVSEPSVNYQVLAEAAASRQDYAPIFQTDEKMSPTEDKVTGYWSSLEVLGQANLTYIITQSRDKIVFVDQHAAHERVAYEKLMAAWKGGKIDVQDFLFPLAVDLSPDKVEALMTHAPEMERLGVHIEVLGPGTVGVKAAPLIVKDAVLSQILDKMASEIVEQGGSYSLERAVGDICATMACHSVVRAGQALGFEQMRNLLVEMDQFPLSSFCPHGRPVSVEYPFYKLEKDFGRIV